MELSAFFFSSRRRHTRLQGDWSSDVCSSDLAQQVPDGARQVADRQHGDSDLMSLLTRRGFTLIELMIALVLLGLVSTAVYKVLVNNQRVYLAQTQTIDLQQNIRAAAAILPAEFRELDAELGRQNGGRRADVLLQVDRLRLRQVHPLVVDQDFVHGGRHQAQEHQRDHQLDEGEPSTG